MIADSSAWWLGDWLIYGQEHYPDRYKHAIAQTSLDYQTLRNYAWVARRFGPARRREQLSFQHHAEVAGMGQLEQERWLAEAESGRWSRNELRRRIRASTARGTREMASVQVSVPPRRKEQWQQAAETSGMELLEWIGVTLDDAAQDVLAHRVAELEVDSGTTAA